MYKWAFVAYSRARLAISDIVRRSSSNAGKITIFTMLSGALVATIAIGTYFEAHVPRANADNVVTSVTVLNTPPQWTVDAQESTESSTSTPTNAGSVITWLATADDSNLDSYFMLICKTSASPTAYELAPPECGGGVGNRWARSATTTSGSQATAATTTIETFPFDQESNAWFAWICDAHSPGPQCNATYKQGTGTTLSPFVVNHPPVFHSISNDSPANPGETVTWTSGAYDTDTIRGGDTLTLYVCKSNTFTGTSCGSGGTWATSTAAASNPATTTPVVIPSQDKNYEARVYIADQNNLVATSTNQGLNSLFVVSNVAPSVSAATVTLIDPRATTSSYMALFTPNSTSGPFYVKFTVTDNNSCLNASSTAETVSATTSIYRSGVGQNSCQLEGNFNTNSCYPSANTQTQITCFQATSTLTYGIVTNACDGSSESTVDWVCSFPLWYNADPTDGGSASSTQYYNQNWLASVAAIDDDFGTSTISQSSTGNELNSFLAFDVTETSISYGGLQPGQSNDPLATTTDLIAVGNVGLDEDLYGDTMCTNWTAFDSCDAGGINPASEIPVSNQKFASSSVAYASSYAYTLTSSTSPASLLINVPKTTSTSSPQTKNTWWGINIPVAITVAGAYTGQNTLTAKKSDPSLW